MTLAQAALRGVYAWWDWPAAATRQLWQLQQQGVATLEAADYGEALLATQRDAQRAFVDNAAQMLESARRATHAIAELQRQLGRIAQSQAGALAQTTAEVTRELPTSVLPGDLFDTQGGDGPASAQRPARRPASRTKHAHDGAKAKPRSTHAHAKPQARSTRAASKRHTNGAQRKQGGKSAQRRRSSRSTH